MHRFYHRHMEENTFMIVSCGNKARHEQWSKAKGVFTDIISICEALKQVVQECDQNLVSTNFMKSSNEAFNENLDQLDQSFMRPMFFLNR